MSNLAAKIKKQDIVFAVLFLFILLLSGWKCKFGFGGFDEAFYLSIPYRLSMGDALLADEWHLSQMSSFLLYPVVRIYLALFDSTDGMILVFRYVYLFFHTCVSVVIYLCLRKRGFAAVLAAALYFLFTPYNIMAMSYNTMGLSLVALTGALLARFEASNKKVLFLCGALFAGAVLCNPYLGFVFLGYFAAVLLKRHTHGMLSFHAFRYVLYGVSSLAALFLIFVFSRAGIGEIIKNIPGIFNDPEHSSSFLDKFLFKSEIDTGLLWLFVLLQTVLLLALAADKKRMGHRAYYLAASAVIFILCQLQLIPAAGSDTCNLILFPINMLGITAFLLSRKQDKSAFAYLWLFGVVYSVCMNFSSNQHILVMSMALAVSAMASILFIGNICRELLLEHQKKNMLFKLTLALTAISIVFQFGLQAYAKISHVFWDEPPWKLSVEIGQGPAKGIITRKEIAGDYNAIYEDLEYYRGIEQKSPFLFASYRTWGYLCTGGMTFGTYSAWLSGEDAVTMERLREYYQLHPEKVPVYIYIPKNSSWNLVQWQEFAVEYGYSAEESAAGYRLKKYKE